MAWLLDNPEKEYIESVKTDVMKTWRKFGFVPPSELKEKQDKEGTPQFNSLLVTDKKQLTYALQCVIIQFLMKGVVNAY